MAALPGSRIPKGVQGCQSGYEPRQYVTSDIHPLFPASPLQMRKKSEKGKRERDTLAHVSSHLFLLFICVTGREIDPDGLPRA